MPRLWNASVEAHRRAVRDATLEATAALVAERGLTAVTMSAIAERTGIGRATLYKYFPDVEAILRAWLARQVETHLAQLTAARDREGDATARLGAVLRAYAELSRRRHGTALAAALHDSAEVARAQHQVLDLVRDLVGEAARSGHLRDDVPARELAAYCLHALSAASSLHSQAAVGRLVTVTLDGLRPPPAG